MEVKKLLMKLLSSLIVCTILCMSLNGFFNKSVAASTGTVSVSSNKAKVRVGENFIVTISAQCSDGIHAVDTKLKYDPNKLELVNEGLVNTKKWTVFNMEQTDENNNPIPGQEQITVLLNTSETITSADLYQVEFKVKNTVTSGTALTVNFEETILDPYNSTSGEAINIGTKTAEVEAYKTSLTSSKYTVANSKVSKVSPKTTIAQLKSNLTIVAQDIKIYDLKGNVISSDTTVVGTGMRIVLDSDTIFTFVVTGDVDGDGDSKINDLLGVNKHRLGKNLLTGVYLDAGDVNSDGTVDVKDLLQINKARLGKISL